MIALLYNHVHDCVVIQSCTYMIMPFAVHCTDSLDKPAHKRRPDFVTSEWNLTRQTDIYMMILCMLLVLWRLSLYVYNILSTCKFSFQ